MWYGTPSSPGTPSIPATSRRAAKNTSFPAHAPSRASLEWLNRVVDRSHREKGVPLSVSDFIQRTDKDGDSPPLAQMIRGGQGGAVRLKLYLTISLLAVSAPYDIDTPIPARVWAQMLDLTESRGNGARRVNDAFAWLDQHRFLISSRRRGAPGSIVLLRQSGSGEPYARPAGLGRYVQLPLGLWQKGWIVTLSGAALAILIIILDLRGGRALAWVSPKVARERYDLSPDTWQKGVRELGHYGIITVSKRPQGDFFDYRRLRNAYQVNDDVIAGAVDGSPRRRAATRRPRRGERG
jgi:hypothetical protein